MNLPRILSAVPQAWPVRLEIAKAVYMLAKQIAEDERRRLDKIAAADCGRDPVAEVFHGFYQELCKAGFNPNEPRVPAGNLDGGQWTKEDGSSNRADGRVLSDATPDNNWIPGGQYAANDPPGIGHNQGPPLDGPPEIPAKPPLKIGSFIKAAAYWIASATARADKRVALFLAALLATTWLVARYYRYVVTYQDPPKTWEELQQNVGPGYDRHHVVEQWSVNDGIPRSKIDGSENVVPIPTLKHWQINSWLGKPSSEFKNVDGEEMSPRAYIKGRPWGERYEFGLDALRRFKVLKP